MSDPEKLTRHWRTDPRKRIRKRGFELQEQRTARAHGAELTRGSGSSNRTSQKGDSVGDYFRASNKTTEKNGAKSIRVERVWLREIEAQARATGHRPLFTLGFSADSAHPTPDDWIAFMHLDAEHLMKCAMLLLQGNDSEARAHAALALGEAA